MKDLGNFLFVILFTVRVNAVVEAPQSKKGEKKLHATARKLLKEPEDVFSDMPRGLPPMRTIGHAIDTGDSPPVSKPSYRLSPKEKEEVEREVKIC